MTHISKMTHCLSPITLAIVSCLTSQVMAQQTEEAAGQEYEVIEVTGIRGSLNKAINLKRGSTLTTESISAEDIGKFPDLNLAESLQRISGVAITRDNGEGQQISLRGLGPSFSRVLWNGVPISTASNGGTDVSAENRQFDFDVFSSDLFTQIDVSKSAAAHQVEGGISGVVNIRSARAFDFGEGFNATTIYKHGFNDLADSSDPNFTAIVSNTFADDTFGALFGFTTQQRDVRVDGFESQDWVSQSAGGYTFDVSDGNNSGLSDEALDTLLLPRLPRTEMQFGDRNRISYVAAFQYKPSDDFEINLDILGAQLESDIHRHNLDVEIRNQNDLVPTNASVRDNNTVESITLQGADRRSENRKFYQETEQLHTALSATWFVNDEFKLEAVLSSSTSEYELEEISFLASVDDTEVTIVTPSGSHPITEVYTNVDITNPDNFVLNTLRANFIYRDEKDTAFHVDGTWGDDDSNLRFGVAFDSYERDNDYFRNTSNTPANNITGDVPELSQIASTLPFNDYLSVLNPTDGAISNHLIINPDDAAAYFDYDQIEKEFSAVREAGTYFAKETTTAGYVEVNHTSDFLNREFRFNAGTRLINTEVDVAAPFLGNDLEFSSSYTELLPSFNLAWDVVDDLVVRVGAARTITRPIVSSMVPRTSVSSDFSVSRGNQDLEPYLSNQIDLGLEWYFADESLLALSYYDKSITGFIQNESTSGPFSDSGIDISTLDSNIYANLTPDTIVDFVQPQNVADTTEITGFEILYQQPLSFIVDGLGTMINYSKINGSTSFVTGNDVVVPSNIVGLSDENYNLVVYYETERFSIRGSYNFRSDYTTAACCRNNQPFLKTREGSGQFDMSATYTLPFAENVTLTMEGINLNENDEYTYFGTSDRLQRYVGTGRQVFLGARAIF